MEGRDQRHSPEEQLHFEAQSPRYKYARDCPDTPMCEILHKPDLGPPVPGESSSTRGGATRVEGGEGDNRQEKVEDRMDRDVQFVWPKRQTMKYVRLLLFTFCSPLSMLPMSHRFGPSETRGCSCQLTRVRKAVVGTKQRYR